MLKLEYIRKYLRYCGKQSIRDLLLEIGFAEIEVGFPAASQPDFDFIRRIIEEDRIPEGVTVQILCQARAELIDWLDGADGRDRPLGLLGRILAGAAPGHDSVGNSCTTSTVAYSVSDRVEGTRGFAKAGVGAHLLALGQDGFRQLRELLGGELICY